MLRSDERGAVNARVGRGWHEDDVARAHGAGNRGLVECVRDGPADDRWREPWAAVLSRTARTPTRAGVSEVAMSFARWRGLVGMRAAGGRLAGGGAGAGGAGDGARDLGQAGVGHARVGEARQDLGDVVP